MTDAGGRPVAPAPASAAGRAQDDAEATALTRLVAIYLRESGLGAPAPLADADADARALADAGVAVAAGAPLGRVPLPRSGLAVVGAWWVRSAGGHHRLGPPLWLVGEAGPPRPVGTATELARLVAAELAARHGLDRGAVAERVAALARRAGVSVGRSARFRARRLAGARPAVLDDADPGLAAEQALASGHPFHPTPKEARGFDDADLARYAPEMGGAFPLWWLAGPPELVGEARLVRGDGRPALPTPDDVAATARARLGPGQARWRLLPCHPWQARTLAARPDVAAALDAGDVRLLGPLGADVHPTSSVRTVRAGDGYWKLALDVRITNFVRRNTPEEVRRTLDAGRLLTALGAAGPPGPSPAPWRPFEVLVESGARWLAFGGTDDDAGDLAAASGALWRPGPPAGPVPMVVAGLLEEDPCTGVAPLVDLVGRAATGDGTTPAQLARSWLRAYLAVTLRPLLRLLVGEGVSLEAHTQNALVGFVAGWPRRLVVRDLEGTSVDRTHPAAARHRRALGPGAGDSPVLYPPEDAWRRFAYYVVVNHVGHVVATLATGTDAGEEALWPVVADAVLAEAAGAGGAVADQLGDALLGARLPAKANLVSDLLGVPERPAYVDVANPYRPAAGVR